MSFKKKQELNFSNTYVHEEDANYLNFVYCNYGQNCFS